MESHYLLSSEHIKFAESLFRLAGKLCKNYICCPHAYQGERAVLYQPAVGSAEIKISPCPAVTGDKSSCPHTAIRPNLCLAPCSPHTTELPEPGPRSVAGAVSITPGLSLQSVLNLQHSCGWPVLQSHGDCRLNMCTRKSSVWISWFSGWIPRLESEGQLGTRGWLGNPHFSADNHHQLHGCHSPFLPSTWLPPGPMDPMSISPPSTHCCSAGLLDTMETFGSITHISPQEL